MMTALNTINPLVIPFVTNPFTISNEYLIKVDKIKKESKDFNFNTKEADKFIDDGRVSNNLYNEALRISDGDQLVLFNLVSKGIETNQWIRFAIYFMTDPIATRISFIDKESKELVNAITTLAGFGKVYESDDVADIDEFDCTKINSKYSGRFLLHKPELVDFLSNPQFQMVMRAKIIKMAEENRPVDSDRPALITVEEDEIRYVDEKKNQYANPAFAILEAEEEKVQQPVFSTIDENNPGFVPFEFGFVNQKLPKKGAGVNAHVYTKFEAILGKFIPETVYYHYEYINNFYHLYITRPDTGAEEFYILDDGSIMGGSSISILANYITPEGFERSMFVDICAHPAITSKILSRTLFNYLTPEEVEECKGDFLYDTRIYNNIDFHNTDFFDDFAPEQKYNFEVSLLGVLSVLGLVGYDCVRFRFGSFSDYNHFTLVSDCYMYRPLPFIQKTVMPDTCMLDGAKIIVDGIYVYVEYNGEVKKFKMG